MSLETLREQMNILIKRRNEQIILMEYHSSEVVKAKNEANSLNGKIEAVNNKISIHRHETD